MIAGADAGFNASPEDAGTLVALTVPPESRVLAVAPDGPLLDALGRRGCRVWAVVPDDATALPGPSMSEDMVTGDLDRIDPAARFPGTTFDAAVITGALERVASPTKLLSRVAALVGADAPVVMTVANATSVGRRVRLLAGDADADASPAGRAFDVDQIRRMVVSAGLSIVEMLRARSADRVPAETVAALPEEVVAFLEKDPDGDTEHFVVVARGTGSDDPHRRSLAEELQQSIAEIEGQLRQRQADLAVMEEELDALQRDLALKDDFAIDLRGKLQAAEARAATAESELATVRTALETAHEELAVRAGELEDLRRPRRPGIVSRLLERSTRQR